VIRDNRRPIVSRMTDRPTLGRRFALRELEMYRALCTALVIAAVITSEVSAQERDHKVDKTIELTPRDGKLVFI
jgi:hypothetical protein